MIFDDGLTDSIDYYSTLFTKSISILFITCIYFLKCLLFDLLFDLRLVVLVMRLVVLVLRLVVLVLRFDLLDLRLPPSLGGV